MTRRTVGSWTTTDPNVGHVDVGVVAQREVRVRAIQGRKVRPIRKARHTCPVSLSNVECGVGVNTLDDGQGNSSVRIASHDWIRRNACDKQAEGCERGDQEHAGDENQSGKVLVRKTPCHSSRGSRLVSLLISLHIAREGSEELSPLYPPCMSYRGRIIPFDIFTGSAACRTGEAMITCTMPNDEHHPFIYIPRVNETLALEQRCGKSHRTVFGHRQRSLVRSVCLNGLS